MAEETKEKTEEKVKEKAVLHEAFYIVPKAGGFQIRKVTIEEDVVLEDAPYSDPDAWDPVMNIIENELSKKFQ